MVRWGDCDPAGIIYTPKAIDYALETIENWLIEEIGVSWMDMRNKGKGLASVKFGCEYLAPMTGTQIRTPATRRQPRCLLRFQKHMMRQSNHFYMLLPIYHRSSAV